MKYIIGIILILVVVLVYFEAKESKRKKEFFNAHCFVIGEMSASTSGGYGLNLNGNGMSYVRTYTPGKTGYQCDDGKVYWD